MEFSVSYEEGLDVVSGKIEGDLTVEIAAEYFAKVGEVASQRGCERVLTDVRSAKLMASEEGMLALSRELESIGMDTKFRRAIVLNDDVKGYKVWENYCFRQGYTRIKLFYDQLKALDWLGSN